MSTDPPFSFTDFWSEVAEACFRHDDGSLPGIILTHLTPRGVSAIYSMLRSRSELEGNAPEFWCRTQRQPVPVDSVPDAAALVAAGTAEPFHHCIKRVRVGGVELPTLGVFVFQDEIELDYRMGHEWNLIQVSSFFTLLKECCALDQSAQVAPAKTEGPPDPAFFASAWSWFCQKCYQGEK